MSNFKIFYSKKFLKYVLIFLVFYSFILYEDYQSNGTFILNHIPEGGALFIQEDNQVKLSFIYNINFYDLIQNHIDITMQTLLSVLRS